MNKKMLIGPFIGEFGWELLYWQGLVRKICISPLFSDYQKFVVSREGMALLYENVDQFISIPNSLFPQNYSARAYTCDGWVNDYPSEFTARSFSGLLWTAAHLILKRRNPFPKPNNVKPPYVNFRDSAENYLSELRILHGGFDIELVPWKKNQIFEETVGQEFDKNFFGVCRSSTFRPNLKAQEFKFLQPRNEYSKTISQYFPNDVSNYVAVFPRNRKYRRTDKNWSQENYERVIEILQSKFGLGVALLGTPSESHFQNGLPKSVIDLINIPNSLRLDIQTSFLNSCYFSFGAMSGATLYSLACGTPTLIFGDTGQAERYYEENVLRSPLIYLPSSSPSIEWVTNAIEGMLKFEIMTGKI